ncbi:hypothetical protein ACVW0Y_004036 [Pseudomonas sp. TE3786]
MKDLYDFSDAKRGAVAPSKGKTRITIMLDDAVLDAARQRAESEGTGYQTLINRLLKEALCAPDGDAQQATLQEILTTLLTLSKGQEALEAKLDRDTKTNAQPGAALQRYSREESVQLQVRETAAEMNTGKKPRAKP